jgi:hypothetical protein
VGSYSATEWRIEPRCQEIAEVEQAGVGQHGEAIRTASTHNKRVGKACVPESGWRTDAGDLNNDEQGVELSSRGGSDRRTCGIGEARLGTWT